MAYAPSTYGPPVATLPEANRAAFMLKVYQHLALAVASFIVIETGFFSIGLAEAMYDFVATTRAAWFLILGAFMVGQMMVSKAAADMLNPSKQYGALFAMAALEALIFAPFLYYVFNVQNDSGTVASAAFVTLIGFAGLSVVAVITRRDLSFMRPLIMWGGMVALVLIASALLFGLNLGVWFSVAMIGLAGGSILYSTQRIYRTYPEQAYVSAALQLFASLMTMFWYVLRLFSRR